MKPKSKRPELFAYVISDRPRAVIHFTRHFSRFGAEKHYGDLSRHYRGNAYSDYELAVLTREELQALGDSYEIDWKQRTLTEKKNNRPARGKGGPSGS